MAVPAYSTRFISVAGLSGTGPSVVVPTGRVYVVKQLTVYASPLLGTTAVFFEDGVSGGALFAARFNINEGGWVGFYGHLVFMAGQAFHFQVNASPTEHADVYAGGFDLSASG